VNAREVLFPEPVTAIEVITPRRYVALMIMSGAELGRALKDAVRDELYERRRKPVSPPASPNTQHAGETGEADA
jgi:homoserine kinase